MARQTLKRHESTSGNANDDLNDDDYDVTWGGKRPRYIYNFTLKSSDDSSKSSDETESVYSVQSKSTMEVVSEEDASNSSSYCYCSNCCSDCECRNSSRSNLTEFDVRSSSSSCHNIDSNLSDSSTTVDSKAEKNNMLHDKAVQLNSDNGYLPEDTDNHACFDPKPKLPPPACFKTCLQCRKENPNPYFQYCYTCFKFRMNYFEKKPKPKRKKLRCLICTRGENGRLKDSQESSFGLSSLVLSQKQNMNTKDIETSQMEEYSKNVCNICLIMPKNGVFNHGKIGHVYSCYPCAKQLWKKSSKCPICNVKIKFVTKIINV